PQARIADSSSTKAVNLLSVRTTHRFPSSRCASKTSGSLPWQRMAKLCLDSSPFTNHLSLLDRAVSSVVEHLVYTERVGGSKPSPPIFSIVNRRIVQRSEFGSSAFRHLNIAPPSFSHSMPRCARY